MIIFILIWVSSDILPFKLYIKAKYFHRLKNYLGKISSCVNSLTGKNDRFTEEEIFSEAHSVAAGVFLFLFLGCFFFYRR